MKLLIGIMRTIENEFEECIAAIKSQTHQNFDYFVIQNLPNKLAHDTLYKRFMDNADKYDLFIKIDADMVLCRNTFFEEVITKMQKEPEIDNLQIAVHDFFTDNLIYGLNIFRNTVKWKISDEKIFVDRIEVIKKRVNDKTILAPAAYHCPNPSPFQAYHFGLHKAVKVMQINTKKFDDFSSKYHFSNIIKTINYYKKSKNKLLIFTILGAEISFKKKFAHNEVDFNNIKMLKYFQFIDKLSESELESKVKSTIRFIEKPNIEFKYNYFIFKANIFKWWYIKFFLLRITSGVLFLLRHFIEKLGKKIKNLAQ